MTSVRFSVHGKPATAGSKKAFPYRGKDGRLHAIVTDDSGEKGKSWRSIVVDACRRAYAGPVLEGPLVLDIVFRLLRPKNHFGKKGLLPSAPDYPAVKPDATKLLRALEDALNGVLWGDDSRIVVQRVRKVYGESEGADVLVSFAPKPGDIVAAVAPDQLPLLAPPGPASPAYVSWCECACCLAERARGERP